MTTSQQPEDAAPTPKRVFIVGCRRSGTTWLAMLLASHPRVVALQQSSLFHHLESLFDWMDADAAYGRTVLSAAGSDTGDLQRQPVQGIYAPERFCRHMRTFVEDVYDELARTVPDTLAVVDHQPEHVRLWRHIHAVLPDAWFVNMIRDPRSVFSSFRASARTWSSRRDFTTDPIEFSADWCSSVRQGREIAAATPRYIEIGYERLRENGPDELLRIYRELGLTADLEQCRRTVEACSLDRLRSTRHGPRGFFRRGETTGWRRELPRRAVRILEHQCAPLMDELGYQRDYHGRSTPLAVRWHDWRTSAREACRRWIHQGDGRFRGVVRRIARSMPSVYRLAWRIVRW